nr:Methyltransferase domain protein [uncultured bacterium]AIA15503.1 Methyltransferase domain protein [uncultured bacterium]
MKQDDYWAIAENDIEIQNPVTDRKLRLLDDYCDVRDGTRVLDVACGKAWLMRHWADLYDIQGTGIETNPAFVSFARNRPPKRGEITYHEQLAETFEPQPGSYDVGLCLGATFALGGFVQSVEWLVRAVRVGGAVAVGDLSLRHRPTVSGHQHLPLDATELAAVMQRHGVEVSALISASDADFERYASHHRHATVRWAIENRDHPDHNEVLDKSTDDWNYYMRQVRPHLGWTIVVGHKL